MADALLDAEQVADLIGVKKRTVWSYNDRARTRRETGTTEPGDMPEPAAVYGRSPVWKESQIRKWMKTRPGQGTGGGRPWPTYTRDGRQFTRTALVAEYRKLPRDDKPDTFDAWLGGQLMRGTITELQVDA